MALREIPHGAERIMRGEMVPFIFYKQYHGLRGGYVVSHGNGWTYSSKSVETVLRHTVILNSRTGMRILQDNGFIGIPLLVRPSSSL